MNAQSKKMSLTEACSSTFIGFVVSYISNLIILPIFSINISFTENFVLVCWFTVISIIRGYFVRRLFERLRR